MTKAQSQNFLASAAYDEEHREFARQGWIHVRNVHKRDIADEEFFKRMREELDSDIRIHIRAYRMFDGRRVPEFVSVWVRN